MERKGRRFAGWGLDLKRIASIAYGFPEERIAVSDRLPKDRYDVVVVAPYTAPRSESDLLRQSLETAFDVRVSSELRATDVYILSVGTGGPRNLRRPEVASTRIWRDDARVTGVNATFGGLAQELEAILKKPVLDETGVRDRHDFALRLSGDDPGAVARALESQLGLALRPAIRNREYLRLQ
jgi:uncharacterized protein (TIGR03435 family)